MTLTSSGQETTDSLNGKLTFEQDKNRIVGRDATNLIRMMILADGTQFRMQISEPGVSVLDATADEINFDTNNKLFKIVAEGTITAPGVSTVADGTNTKSGGQTATAAHGLGFTPLAIAFVEVSPGQYSLMPYTETVSANDPAGGLKSEFYRLTTSSTDVEVFHYVVTYAPGVGTGFYPGADIKYYLLQQSA